MMYQLGDILAQNYTYRGICLLVYFYIREKFRYEFVKQIIEETNSKSVLDLGCGEGSFLKEVTKLNS